MMRERERERKRERERGGETEKRFYRVSLQGMYNMLKPCLRSLAHAPGFVMLHACRVHTIA
jgi:hypothetical protein